MGGTGFVAANDKTGNYIDALQRGDWVLPYGSPPLIVIKAAAMTPPRKLRTRRSLPTPNGSWRC